MATNRTGALVADGQLCQLESNSSRSETFFNFHSDRHPNTYRFYMTYSK
jgi:hypothetical protein